MRKSLPGPFWWIRWSLPEPSLVLRRTFLILSCWRISKSLLEQRSCGLENTYRQENLFYWSDERIVGAYWRMKESLSVRCLMAPLPWPAPEVESYAIILGQLLGSYSPPCQQPPLPSLPSHSSPFKVLYRWLPGMLIIHCKKVIIFPVPSRH